MRGAILPEGGKRLHVLTAQLLKTFEIHLDQVT